tara:strand:+ start:583 stop:1416 length:834 start_codon:yes stop_codon:yes gene_type:complete
MNPFKLTEPSCISFSGGRTSAYMLWRFIEANDGLPDDCIVTFANTGKEEEATLRFVERCSKEWDVSIVWLEYQWAEETKDRFKVVDFDTAARNGEPFEALIHAKKYLPNPVARFCTIEMKIRTIANYLWSIGHVEKRSHGENMAIVGIRADEQRRAAKIEPHRRPLVTAGVTKETVTAFWDTQLFDLELPNVNGVTLHGNCDLCYLKGANLIESLIVERPSRADWWARMEREVPASQQSGALWRNDRPSYAQMQVIAREQGQLDLAGDETIPCFCGD